MYIDSLFASKSKTHSMQEYVFYCSVTAALQFVNGAVFSFFVHAPLSIVWCTGWTCVYYEVTSSDDGQDNLLNQDCDCEWCQSVAIRARSGEPPN